MDKMMLLLKKEKETKTIQTVDFLKENDKKEGKGIHRYANGDVYEGEFKNNLFEGKGVLKYATGSIYVEEFKYYEREGKGNIEYPIGDVFEGEFKNNK